MPKYRRSANGSGTVRYLGGNRRKPWQAVAPAIEDDDGNLIRKSIGYFETRKDALDALALYRLCPAAVSSEITLDELHKQWIDQGYKNLGKQAIIAYNAAWAKFKPIFNYKVTDIKTPQFQFCIDSVAEQNVSASTLGNMKIVANKLEKYAMQLDIINKNYAQFIVLPKTEKTERTTFTDFELRTIEQGAKDNVGVSAHILIMCFTGWRIQEYCNLTIFDYDRKARTLKGGLKTEAGKNRIVPLPDKIIPLIEAQFERSEKLYPHNSQTFRINFYKTLAALGIQPLTERRLTPHTTRHTYNSMLANQGVPVDIRMKLMGQTDQATNINVYTHADIDTLAKAVGKL